MEDALSMKSSFLAVISDKWFKLDVFKELDVEVKLVSDSMMLAAMLVVEPILMNPIKEEQFEDPNLAMIRDHIANRPNFQLVDGILYFKNRLCVQNTQKLTEPIMTEAHNARYSCTLGVQKFTEISRANFGGIIEKGNCRICV